jgi:hypothetical protein
MLQKTSSFASSFKGDPDALWVIAPLLHLVSEILYTMAFYLLPAPVPPTPPKDLLIDSGTEDAAGSTSGLITSEVVALETKQPETWTIEPAQSNQGPITKGSNNSFYIISNSTGKFVLPNPCEDV